MTSKTPNNQSHTSQKYHALFARAHACVVRFAHHIKRGVVNISGRQVSTSASLLLLMFIALGLVMPHAAHADPVTNYVAGKAIDIASAIWTYLFQLIQVILVVILAVVSFILDNVFWYNVILNPTNMPAVITGWLLLRDIANGLFLLVLLYIAIQMIWGFGGSGKQVVRLIIVAFLINFSLAITGAVFGFGNALALPFQKALGKDVAGFIIDRARLNTVYTTNTDSGVKQAADAANAAMAASKCAAGGLIDQGKFNPAGGCALGDSAASVMSEIAGKVGNAVLSRDSVKDAMQAFIADLFLIMVIITFGGAIGFLIVRIVMMAFLGVLSPAAFFLYAVPGTESLFKRWRKNVIGWAFIAPMFYFLFYLSLLILDAMAKAPLIPPGTVSFAANIFNMLPLVIFLVFLWATLKMCKSLGGEFADAAINLGTKAAGLALAAGAGVATGGASLALGAAGGGLARAAGPTIQGGLERIAARPILGKVAKPITKPIAGYYQRRNEEIQKLKQTKYGTMSTRDLINESRTTLSADKMVAMHDVLKDRGELHKLDKPTYDKMIRYSEQLGRTDFLKARPDAATKANVPEATDDYDAKKRVLNKMTPKEKSLISRFALENDDVKKATLETMTRRDLQEIFKSNADMMQTLIYGFFRQNEQSMRAIMQQETLQFIDANMRIQTALHAQRQQNPQNPANPTAPPGAGPANPPPAGGPTTPPPPRSTP